MIGTHRVSILVMVRSILCFVLNDDSRWEPSRLGREPRGLQTPKRPKEESEYPLAEWAFV